MDCSGTKISKWSKKKVQASMREARIGGERARARYR
jgi:hypothetical protein